jgi:hypothetical protein
VDSRAHATPARRAGRALVWSLALLLGLLLWATVSRVTYGGGSDVDRLGAASVVDCTGYGPVSRYGFGTTYGCTANVHWSSGEVERREFVAGQLSPADAGSEVPVYLDVPDGYRGESYLGRNDGARYSQLRLPLMILFGSVAVALGLGAAYSLFRVFRPAGEGAPRQEDTGRAFRTRAAEQRKAGRRETASWPVGRDEVAGVTPARITLRLRWLTVWCAVAILYTLGATIPRFDAPRGRPFVPPWPQIERALLVDLPPTAVVILGLGALVLLPVMAAVSRTDAARVVRYGPAYVGRDLPGKGSVDKRVETRLRQLAAGSRRRLVAARAIGLLLFAGAIWAAIRVVAVVAPAGAPPLVWLASARDAVLLALLAAIWLGTIEVPHRRLERLLARHRETRSIGEGTVGDAAPS